MCKGWTDESSSILIPLSPWSESRMRILWSTALTFSFLPIVMQASVIVCQSGGKIPLTWFYSIWLHLSARRRRWTSFSSALTTCVQILASTQELVCPHKFLLKFISYCPRVRFLLIAEFHVHFQGRMREYLLVLLWLPQTWIRWANDPSEKFQTFFFEKRRLYLPSWVNVALYLSRPMCSKRWGEDIDSIDQFILMIAKNSFTWQWQNDKMLNRSVFHKVCSPSRSSMLTSRRPDTTRVQDLYAW